MSIGAGRPPIPAAIKAAEGNGKRDRGGRLIVPDPPAGPVGTGTCPEWLSERGKLAWTRLTSILVDLGVAREADEIHMAMIANAYSILQEAREELDVLPKGERFLIKHKGGTVQQHPLIGVMNRQTEIIHRLACDFGLTPAARIKLMRDDMPPPAEGASLEDILSAGEEEAGSLEREWAN